LADIDAIIAERKDAAKRAKEAVPLVEHGGDRKSDNQVSNTNLKASKCDAEYLTARIARDNPDILERMKAGEFASGEEGKTRTGAAATNMRLHLRRFLRRCSLSKLVLKSPKLRTSRMTPLVRGGRQI
jgi:hypothetical protein